MQKELNNNLILIFVNNILVFKYKKYNKLNQFIIYLLI